MSDNHQLVQVQVVKDKWEYLELTVEAKQRAQKLNELGAQGWELVQFHVVFSNWITCFKRRIV